MPHGPRESNFCFSDYVVLIQVRSGMVHLSTKRHHLAMLQLSKSVFVQT